MENRIVTGVYDNLTYWAQPTRPSPYFLFCLPPVPVELFQLLVVSDLPLLLVSKREQDIFLDIVFSNISKLISYLLRIIHVSLPSITTGRLKVL